MNLLNLTVMIIMTSNTCSLINSPAGVGDACHAKVAEVGGGGGRLQVASCDWGFLVMVVMVMVLLTKTCILSRLVRLP